MPLPSTPQSHSPLDPGPQSPAASATAVLSDEALMAAHAAGDETAFRTLFDRHAPSLLRVVQRRVQSEDDARDVVQQTLLNVHRARHDFNPERKLKPWLYAIAMNLTREYYRKRYRRNEWSLDAIPASAPPVDPHDPVDDLMVAQTVREAMKSLLDNQREEQ